MPIRLLRNNSWQSEGDWLGDRALHLLRNRQHLIRCHHLL